MSAQLYRHFDKDGRLLYVGCSLAALRRFADHGNVSQWFDKIARVEIENFETIEAARAAERCAIEREAPAHNVHFRTIRPAPRPRKGGQITPTSLRLPVDLREAIEALAEEDGRSVSNYITCVLDEHVRAADRQKRRTA